MLGDVQAQAAVRHVEAYPQALVLIALGDDEAALAKIEEAVRAREHSMAFLRIDPSLDPLRALPRFEALLRAATPAPAP